MPPVLPDILMRAMPGLSSSRPSVPSSIPPPPYLLRLRSSKSFIVGVVCIGIFTDIFLYGLIVPVVPFAITSRAGVEPSQVQRWVSILLAVYGAGLLVASPIFGWMADHTKSRRMPLLLGLIALAGSTLLLCLGRSLTLLILGRLFQGIAAAMVWTVGLALMVDTVGEKEIGQAMGWVSTSMSSALLLGPLLGGIVYDHAGYYAVYAMGFAMIGVDIVLRFVLIERKFAVQWLDIEDPCAKQREMAASFAEKKQDSSKEKENQTTAEVGADPTAISAQGNHIFGRRRRFRLPPFIILLKSPRTLIGMWGTLVQAILLTSFDSVLPLYAKRTFGFNATGSGLLFLAIVIPSVTGPLVGMATDRWGPRWIATGGFLLAFPFFVLLRLVTHSGVQQVVLLCVFLAFIGLALTSVFPPVMAEFAADVDEMDKKHPSIFGPKGAYAQSYGLLNVAYAAGIMIGPIWSGFVEQRAGWGTMAWTLGLLSGLTAIPVVSLNLPHLSRWD
ncbi:MAG: hypothetical protein M1814_006835 [Vezdaea aestivalis]|nr:MAG: hypothetical protein M1814_006835 [Vezdaea aestivalis]